jgi:hypothetical protein
VSILPLEVAWWWLVKSGVAVSSWVLVVTTAVPLVGQLAQRAGVGLNMTWLSVDQALEPTIEALTPLADGLRREVKVADGLPPVAWIHATTSVHPSPPRSG